MCSHPIEAEGFYRKIIHLVLQVDEIYQDDSIGHNINIVVVGFSLLDRREVCLWAGNSIIVLLHNCLSIRS